MDSFEEFDQQARSWEHLEHFGPTLVAEARAVRAKHPDALIAGLIAEHGTPEYDALQYALGRAGMKPPGGPGFLGLLPRRLVMGLVGEKGRAWIEDAAPEGSAKLPVAALLKCGARFAVFDIEA